MTQTLQIRPSFTAFRRALRDYLARGKWRSRKAIVDCDGLREFLESRANFVAQTSLYGYLRTRAGMRYPELFADDRYVRSINIAKWHVWLACLADLAVHAGGLLTRRSGAPPAEAGQLIVQITESILSTTGVPADAGPEFAAHAQRVRARLALCDWTTVDDGEAAFCDSPEALVQWAPIIDELKQLDAEIVRNSVRFRWQEVRRDLRATLRADAVLGSAFRSSV
ncbi:MAG: hypothetical protein WCA09_10620 [Burkholderiales bacterium]